MRDEAASVTNTLIGLSVALGVCVLVLGALVVVISRRTSRAADRRVADAVSLLETRMEEMSGELADAMSRTETETRRSRLLGQLATTLDLDEVVSRTLEAAQRLPGVDAALLSMPGGPDLKPLVAALGLSPAEAERQVELGPPDRRRARSIRISYRYEAAELEANGALVHGGLAVPLAAGEGNQVGYLTVFTRSETEELADEHVERLEELAARAAPAIDNARRFREARQLADLDALTGLHNRRYFHETLARETARAHRYDRRLALIVFDLDDFKEINDRIGHLAGDTVLADVAERVRDVVRSADIACRVGGDEFAVILPESTLEDGDQLYRRIQAAVSARPLEELGMLHLSAGVAELRAEDDALTFFQRADEALYRAKNAGKARAVAATPADARSLQPEVT